MTRIQVLFAISGLAIAAGLFLAFSAPPDALQGEYSRIINIHVPSLWLAFLAFGVTAFSSIMWLIRKRSRWDRLPQNRKTRAIRKPEDYQGTFAHMNSWKRKIQ